VPLFALLQPREEVPDSGARDVVAGGDLQGIGAVVAAHVQPQLAHGIVSAAPGAVNAGIDEFTITVMGTGGHSGYPHRVHDPVLALSAIVLATQQLGARLIDPVVGVACKVTRLDAGSAANVVPGVATGSGTVRTMRTQDRERALAALTTIAEGTAAGYGCTATVTTRWSEPPLVNDVELADRAAGLLTAMGYPVDREWRSFGSDDFAHYSEQARGLMVFVGTGDEHGGLHHPSYLPSDALIETVADALIAGYCAAVR
jgi:amidohydrolase